MARKKRKKRSKKKSRRSRKNKVKLNLKTKTLYSILAIFFILMGFLIVVSFSGEGKYLIILNQFLAQKFGLAMLYLPFISISAGLVLLNAKWQWSKPNVLLASIILMLATMGLFQSGDVGNNTYQNFAKLISPMGTYLTFIAFFVVGLLVLMQASLVDFFNFIAAALEKRKNKKSKKEKKVDDFVKDKYKDVQNELPKIKKKKKGLLGLNLFKKKSKKKLKVNDPDLKDKGVGDDIDGKAVMNDADSDNSSLSKLRKLEDNQDSSQTDQEEDQGEQIQEGDVESTNIPIVWDYPPLSLLSNDNKGQADRGNVKANAQKIEDTLDSFGIKAEVAEVNKGPSVTQYALRITKGTRLNKITRLSTDLALALAAPTGQIRIEAPIAGRSLVGIEVPNHAPSYVTLKTMLGSSLMKKQKSKLAVGLGIDVSSQPVIADIAKMPHMLIAGSTGSGKSVCINALMSSLLFRASPNELKFILIDPKRVELSGYEGIPHLLTPVITEPKKVVSALKWASKEMEERYKKMQDVNVRNIEEYNELAGLAAMPNIVIVIDEMADVMMYSETEVEETITRIAQMARAVGIHLVLATQRPSVDIITGLIKANIPTRIAFNVSSNTDSRVIIDQTGAEKLLGKGDMLYVPPGKSKPIRIQGTFVTSKEIKSLVQFIKGQGIEPNYEEAITTKYKSKKQKIGSLGEKDDKFDDAVRLFKKYDKGSSSLIQRRLRVGYARAARILDQLFEAGLVGPPNGSRPREVDQKKLAEYMEEHGLG